MHRLLYTSEACLPKGNQPLRLQLEILARDASIKNARTGMRGAMIYVDGHFIQVLEGELDQLENTFESICCDLRHENVRLIDLFAISEPMFDGWNMALLTDSGHCDLELRDDLQNIRLLLGVNAREAVAEFSRLLGRKDQLAQAA